MNVTAGTGPNQPSSIDGQPDLNLDSDLDSNEENFIYNPLLETPVEENIAPLSVEDDNDLEDESTDDGGFSDYPKFGRRSSDNFLRFGKRDVDLEDCTVFGNGLFIICRLDNSPRDKKARDFLRFG